MNGSKREGWLVIVFPAVMIALVWYGYLRPTTELASLRGEVEAARATRVPDAAFTNAAQELGRFQGERQELERDLARWNARWDNLVTNRIGASSERVASIEQVSLLFDHAGLQLLGEAPAADATRLAPELEQAVARLARGQSGFKPQLWRVLFQGRYRDVSQALGELERDCPLAIPVQLTMDEAATDSEVRRWTLLLWL